MMPEKYGWFSWLGLFSVHIILLGGLAAQAQERQELPALLEKLKTQYAANRTFQAGYIRDLLPKVSTVLPSAGMKAEGELLFQSPDKLRLDQMKPRPEKLISNGEKVWWYIPADNTVQVFSLKEHGQQVRPITDFLSGLGRLDEHFTVRLDAEAPEAAPFYALVLTPRKPQPDLNRIDLRISKETFLPLEFTFYNLLGDGTRFRFRDIRTGIRIPSGSFDFSPPKGAKVIPQALPPVPKR